MRILVLIIFLIPSIAFAKNFTFQWDPPDDVTGITAYRLYKKSKGGTYGVSGTHVAQVSVGTHTLTYDCDDPSRFVVRSYSGLTGYEDESEDSNEVSTSQLNQRRSAGGMLFGN